VSAAKANDDGAIACHRIGALSASPVRVRGRADSRPIVVHKTDIRAVLAVYEKLTSSMNPEVHNVSQRHRMRTEPSHGHR